MMELLQGIDPGFAVLVVVGCGLLCVAGLAILFVFQLASGLFEIIGTLIGAIGGVLGGGPFAWCGCLVAIFGCGICGLITVSLASVIPQCNTPNAVNFCRLLGY